MELVTDTLIILSNGIYGLVLAGVVMVLMLLALIRKEPGIMLLATLFIIPFSYTLGGWSGFGLFVRFMPLLLLGSTLAIAKDDPIFAWSLPVPVFGYLIYLLFLILSSGYMGIQPVYVY